MAGVSAAQGAAMQQQINFTRHNEYEADRIGIGFLAVVLFQSAITAMRGWLVADLGAALNSQWLANLFGHLLRLPLDFFEKRHVGGVMSRFVSVQASRLHRVRIRGVGWHGRSRGDGSDRNGERSCIRNCENTRGDLPHDRYQCTDYARGRAQMGS